MMMINGITCLCCSRDNDVADDDNGEEGDHANIISLTKKIRILGKRRRRKRRRRRTRIRSSSWSMRRRKGGGGGESGDCDGGCDDVYRSGGG